MKILHTIQTVEVTCKQCGVTAVGEKQDLKEKGWVLQVRISTWLDQHKYLSVANSDDFCSKEHYDIWERTEKNKRSDYENSQIVKRLDEVYALLPVDSDGRLVKPTDLRVIDDLLYEIRMAASEDDDDGC